MLESIEIKNFKRIGVEGLKLEKLAKVNYLVGKNGSGKSSVLEMIALSNEIKNPNFKLKERFRKNKKRSRIPIFNTYIERPNIKYHLSKLSLKSSVKLTYTGEKSKTYIYFSNDQKNYNVRTTNKSTNYLKSKSILFSSSLQFDSNLKNHQEFDNLFHYNNMFWNKILVDELMLKGDFDMNQDDVEIDVGANIDIFKLNSKITKRLFYDKNIAKYSDGFFNIHSLVYDLLYYPKHSFNIILLDEPENSIHPEIHKLLPELFSEITSNCDLKLIISTHSPFIISAAGEYPNTQKVYMIEDGKCLNPEGSSGKDVKGIAATMLGAGIEDLTPSTVVFCAQSEKEFLERINTKWYFKDILFRTPSNGGDSHLNNMAYIEDIFKFGGDFFPNAEILYYRDCFDFTQKTDKDMKQKYDNNEKFKKKIILSEHSSFETKFGEDSKIIEKQIGGKVQNAKNHADMLINKGESGKTEFQKLFPELGGLFGFTGKK